MKPDKRLALLIVIAVLLAACDKFTEKTAAPPTITAQGFEIEAAQQGVVGAFDSLRLRIECPAGIETLQITERSYDIDLATTPERGHFQFFALDRRVLLNKDVTLDFQNYINQKLQQAGDYTFIIRVTDKQGNKAEANVTVSLTEPAAKLETVPSEPASPEQSRTQMPSLASETVPVKTGQFEIERIGPREIVGDQTFGLTWKTVDAIHVTIRVQKDDAGASKLTHLTAGDYVKVTTQDNLEQMLAVAQDQEHIDFDTANNAAVGKVLGVINLGKPYLIKSSQSTTTLSDAGTTVTLKGEYKY